MKKNRLMFLAVFVALMLLLVAIVPAYAQLGDTDVASFLVQNISDSTATVTVTFIAENGTEYTPSQLDGNTPTDIPNPFTLSAGASQKVYVPNIPSGELPSGRYSMVISSNAPVVAQAGLAGTGTTRFSGTYFGFSEGSQTTYLPIADYNHNGWYSMISVQNLGTDVADVTVEILCDTGVTGTLSTTNIPVHASYTWDTETTTPTGFTAGVTDCDGSAIVTSDQPVVAVNNQNIPTDGNTVSFESQATGTQELWIPNLQSAYYSWNSILAIRKVETGPTTVYVNYNTTEPTDTCSLTDAMPFCKLDMPVDHPTSGAFGAVITTTNNIDIIAVVVGTKNYWSGAYHGLMDATDTVIVPNVQKNYYGWVSTITCQNLSTTPTTLNYEFEGYTAFDDGPTLNQGDTHKFYVPNATSISDGFVGGVTVTANASGATIGCTLGLNKPSGSPSGDWTSVFNAPNQ